MSQQREGQLLRLVTGDTSWNKLTGLNIGVNKPMDLVPYHNEPNHIKLEFRVIFIKSRYWLRIIGQIPQYRYVFVPRSVKASAAFLLESLFKIDGSYKLEMMNNLEGKLIHQYPIYASIAIRYKDKVKTAHLRYCGKICSCYAKNSYLSEKIAYFCSNEFDDITMNNQIWCFGDTQIEYIGENTVFRQTLNRFKNQIILKNKDDQKQQEPNENDDDANDFNFHRMEFKKFFKNIRFGTKTEEYYLKMVEFEYDDFETMMELEEDELENDIKMKKIHKKKFLQKIKDFRLQHEEFKQWMMSLQMLCYLNMMMEFGCFTFEVFYSRFKKSDDILRVIGDENVNDAKVLWNNSPKQKRNDEN